MLVAREYFTLWLGGTNTIMYMGPITTFFETGIHNIIKNTKMLAITVHMELTKLVTNSMLVARDYFALWSGGRIAIMYMST